MCNFKSLSTFCLQVKSFLDRTLKLNLQRRESQRVALEEAEEEVQPCSRNPLEPCPC